MRSLSKCLRRCKKGAWSIEIIGVQPCNDLPSRPFESLIDGICLSAVRFANPECYPAFIFSDNFNALVCAASIDDDVLKIRVTLQEHRPDRLLNEPALVVGWRDNTDPRPRLSVRHTLRHPGCLLGPWPPGFALRRRGEISKGWATHTRVWLFSAYMPSLLRFSQ